MTNLPADLPENWTQGQLISPNGTEVGLTTQHGYNYLMAQVNAAQTAINNIVESLGEVAQETSVQDILSLIGTTTDEGATDTTGTLMGKSNKILTDIETIKEQDYTLLKKEFVKKTTTPNSSMAQNITFSFNGAKKIEGVSFFITNTSNSIVGEGNIIVDIDGSQQIYPVSQVSMNHSPADFALCFYSGGNKSDPNLNTVHIRGLGTYTYPQFVTERPFRAECKNYFNLTIPIRASTTYDIYAILLFK